MRLTEKMVTAPVTQAHNLSRRLETLFICMSLLGFLSMTGIYFLFI